MGLFDFLYSKERLRNREAERDAKREDREDRIEARQGGRTDRTSVRQGSRTDRTELTGELPGANAWDFADDFGGQLLDIGSGLASSYLGFDLPGAAPAGAAEQMVKGSQGGAPQLPIAVPPVSTGFLPQIVTDNPIPSAVLGLGAAYLAAKHWRVI
jgi:hypothetical protein